MQTPGITRSLFSQSVSDGDAGVRVADSIPHRWKAWLASPISNGFLPLFRISLGACLVWQIWWYFSTGYLREAFIAPTFHFTWPGFGWVQPWPGEGMYLHFFVLMVAAICILVGFFYRLAALVFFVGYLYVFLIDKCWYLNHYYLIVLLAFISIFLPAHRRLSLDCWRNPSIQTDVAPRWCLVLIQLQVGIPYFYGGVAKLNADWLAGEPLRTWLATSTDFPLIGRWFTEPWCVNLFVYGGLLIDLFAVPALLFKRTRRVALLVLTAFHLMNSQLFQIGVFPWMMIGLTWIAFVSPEVWNRFLPPVDQPAALRRTPQWAIGILGLYVILQIVVPLRHWLYPGHTAFTREGHHFAWRMKLNNRLVDAQFYTRDATGDARPVSLDGFVTAKQERKIRDPNMFIQLAHEIARSNDPSNQPTVCARVTVALNGRPPSPYIDPSVNLTEKRAGIGHCDWIHLRPEEESE